MKVADIKSSSGTLLDTIKSSSIEGVTYEIRRLNSGKIVCSCPAPKICKHIKGYLFRDELDKYITLMEYKGFLEFQSEGSRAIILEGIGKLIK